MDVSEGAGGLLKLPNCKNCGHYQTRHSIDESAVKGNPFPCEACDCKNYEPIGSVTGYDPTRDPLNDPKSPQSIEQKLFPAMKKWAHSYSGYDRFASENWAELLEPLWKQFGEEGRIPSWVGIDLLRASAFFMARSHNWACMSDSYYNCHSVIYAIAYAVQNHKAAKKTDLPPRVPESFRKFGSH